MKNAQLMILLGTLVMSAGGLVIPASASAAGAGAGANMEVEVQPSGTMSPGDAKVGGSNAGHVDIEGSLNQNPQATPDAPDQMTEQDGDSERAPSKRAEKKTKPISTTDTE